MVFYNLIFFFIFFSYIHGFSFPDSCSQNTAIVVVATAIVSVALTIGVMCMCLFLRKLTPKKFKCVSLPLFLLILNEYEPFYPLFLLKDFSIIGLK